jgi:hypothetical protein
MTQDDVIAFVAALPGVVVVTASEAIGAPEVAWGDSFFFYDPDGDTPDDRRMPFATLVIQDYPGFDTASDLDRPGVFRVNVSAGRQAFEDAVGYPPAAHAEHAAEHDYAVLDRVIPHPVYAVQGWVSVLNPGPAGDAKTRELLVAAHALAVLRHTRSGPRPR